MKQNPPDDELLRSYLLEDLPEAEAEDLERRLLADDEIFDLLESTEADLLAALDRGTLAPGERERVLRRLASSPEGRERLALARSLNTVADERLPSVAPTAAPVVPFRRRDAASARPGGRWAALAAAVVLAAAGGLWFARQALQEKGAAPAQVARKISAPMSPARPAAPRKPAPPSAGAPAAGESQSAPDRLDHREERVPPARSEPPAPVKAVFALSLATLRGAEGVEEFRVPPDADLVEIQLDLEGWEDLAPFQATVRSQAGGAVWEEDGLEARQLDWGTALVLEVPAERLPSGRYEVGVTTATGELTQEFEVVQENR